MKVLWIALGICLLLLLAAGGFGFWFQNSLTTPKTHERAETYVTIEKGSTPAQIVAKLVAEGILDSSTATSLYLRTLGNPAGLKAGEYKFPSPITPLQVLALLEKGEERSTRLVIPEGYTRFDIAKRIVEKFPLKEPQTELQILALMNDTSLIRDLAPEAKNLEGYMYPSTYNHSPDATANDIIKTQVEKFRRVWKPEWTTQAKARGLTPHQVITVASLIETETGVPIERPLVASVIYNRLKKGIPLGIDQTAVYIAKMENRWDGTIHRSDVEVNSPYNTRKRAGLPPGPISSVSEGSIQAALNPATSDYLYYVRNVQANDGSHWFYASAADFERGKAEYQRWLEKEREAERANTGNK
jgi:UPF0755 protein